ncbi:hypothetical protein P5G51_011295 [Virgibacillus sp. 179-BFC.A HS]|uniref:Flagellar hook-length control protein FliK n=1 Tax=Tigheibacillus jepli TaxID=3035914 RepID=A0ABU5CJ67_9BACI|nr:hypothetical protein [Virgibacillus sp. 179-BFC.A HS]MDY0405897.1 hypothetical protein [Virgibacillus sp. 179-BFC.A HS]
MVQRINPAKLLSVPTQQTNHLFQVGKIMQGKVLHLFPDNHAQIMLDGKKVIAQLNIPLSVGDRRYFQIVRMDDIPELKVFGEKLTGKAHTDAGNLLQTLGMKENKAHHALINYLLEQQTAFTKNELIRALDLYDNAAHKENAKQIIQTMLQKQFPLTESVFKSLDVKLSNTMSSLLRNLAETLKNTDHPNDISRSLLKQINALLAKDNLLLEATSNTFSQMKNEHAILKEFASFLKNSQQLTSPEKMDAETVLKSFASENKHAAELLIRFISQKYEVANAQWQSLLKWSPALERALQQNKPLPANDFAAFQHEFLRHGGERREISKQSEMLQLLAKAEEPELDTRYKSLPQLLGFEDPNKLNRHVFLQKQFLSLISLIQGRLGLDYEHLLLHQGEKGALNLTIKGILLQMMQQHTNTPEADRAEQLLYFINGSQLQAVSETNNVLLANFQLPGEKFGLKGDIALQLSGKKRQDGKIDGDYCRILFYLQLANIDETVIDMNVQKRSVNIIVFNNMNIPVLQKLADEFRPIFSAGLSALDYHLSAITFKKLTKEENMHMNQTPNPLNPFGQHTGVDYRV